MILPNLSGNLPPSFSALLTNRPTHVPENYEEFIIELMKKEAAENFSIKASLLKNDIKHYDVLLNEFARQVLILMPLLTVRSNLFGTKKAKNTLKNLKPDRKAVSKIKINSCFVDISPAAKAIQNKKIEVLRGLLSHPNDFLKKEFGVLKPGEEMVCAALKAISTFNLANTIKETTLQLSTLKELTIPDSKDILNMIQSNVSGMIDSINLPSSVGLFMDPITGRVNNFQKHVGDALSGLSMGDRHGCISSIVSRAVEELIKDVKAISNALGAAVVANLEGLKEKALKDIAETIQQTKETAFKGLDDMIKALSSNEEFKKLAKSLDAAAKEIEGLVSSAVTQINNLLSDTKMAVAEATKTLNEIAAGVQEKLDTLMESTLSGIASLKSEMMATLDLKIDFLDLPIPSINEMINIVKEDVKALHTAALNDTEQKLFGMITEIESYAKTKQLSQRAKALSTTRDCIKKQFPSIQLESISFINNLALTGTNDLDIMKIQNRISTKLDAQTLEKVKKMHKIYKKEITAAIPQDGYYKLVSKGVL